MNLFMGFNLIINGLLTIYVWKMGAKTSEDMIKRLENAHYLCLFGVIVTVIST